MQLRVVVAILALVLTACTSSIVDQLDTAAVFVSGKALFGIDARLEAVRELIPFQHPVDYEVLSAQFSGDGQSILIHRDWEGRDSWWAANPDGTGLRRLQLPVDYQIQHAFRFCQQEFVGVLNDGRFLRFDLHGKAEYWSPEEGDRRLPDTPVLSSPSTNLFAYLSKNGVVVALSDAKSTFQELEG